MRRAALRILCVLIFTGGVLSGPSVVAAQPPEGEAGDEAAGSTGEETPEPRGVDAETSDEMLGHEEIPPPEGLQDADEVGEDPNEGDLDGEEEEFAPPPPPPPVPSASDDAGDGGEAGGQADGGGGGGGGGLESLFHLRLHGYYRARLVTTDAQPVPGPSSARDQAAHAAYGFMRLRLNPSVLFGSDVDKPRAGLHMQIDALDNVVFGDNARVAGTPLFASDPSRTSLIDGDLTDYFFLRRLWLEVNVELGVVRIGRQASHGGLGILFNDGNDFRNDFGDALDGTTFDRILFATRPLTVFNALNSGDRATTPLVFAIAYDWLAEDTLGVGSTPRARSDAPFAWVTGGEDDVWQTTLVLAWLDEDFNRDVSDRDELRAGLYLVHRGQDSTSSDIYIGDFFYRLRWSAFGPRSPAIYSEGEIYTIQGNTNGVALFGSIDPTTGRTGMQGGANIWGGVARLGVDDPLWAAWLESGFSTGQQDGITAIGSYDTLTQRPNNRNYQVGLLLYPLVLAARTAASYTSTFRAVWSNGGVWNSIYFLPNARIRPLPGVEIIGQFLLAFADHLNVPLADTRESAEGTACGLAAECLLGWEADLALKISLGPNDEIRWSNEFGIMNAGPALGPRLSSSLVWTLQSRIAFVF